MAMWVGPADTQRILFDEAETRRCLSGTAEEAVVVVVAEGAEEGGCPKRKTSVKISSVDGVEKVRLYSPCRDPAAPGQEIQCHPLS